LETPGRCQEKEKGNAKPFFPQSPQTNLGEVGSPMLPIILLHGRGLIKWFFNIIPKFIPNDRQSIFAFKNKEGGGIAEGGRFLFGSLYKGRGVYAEQLRFCSIFGTVT
jgi:hypothetical protein